MYTGHVHVYSIYDKPAHSLLREVRLINAYIP